VSVDLHAAQVPRSVRSISKNDFAAFTRALTCLSKYGDEVTICASPDGLALTATNSSLSAYCRVTYGGQYFTHYTIDDDKGKGRSAMDAVGEGPETVAGQLLARVSEHAITPLPRSSVLFLSRFSQS
jgi:hypothetical protein